MEKNKKLIIGVLLIICMIGIGFVTLKYIDVDALIKTITQFPYAIKFIAITLLVSLQIFLAFLPGEPVELAAGYLLGGWQGTLACLLGSFLGTLIVYGLVKLFKKTIIETMFDSSKIKEAEHVFESKKGTFWVFILFLIPGTPKDIMTYLMSLSNIHLFRWLTISTLGRIPSVITSTFLSATLKEGQWLVSLGIFVFTLLLVGMGGYLYKKTIQE